MLKKLLTVIIVLLALVAAAAIVLVWLAKPADACPACLRDLPRPLVIAHQGGEELWPSNTMYAYERAVALGVDMLEMDLHVTADGALVLMHDETVDRTTDGTGLLEEMSLAQVKGLDAGYYWTADDGQTFPFRGQGITVATLEEVFQAFPDMPMTIEIKLVENQPVVEPFCQLIRQYNMQDKVLVASFHQDALDQFRAACPGISTSATQNEVISFFVRHALGLAASFSPAAQAVQAPEYRSGLHIVTPGFIDDAHSRGMDVHVWTVNEAADMQRMIDLGVDGIITDRPDILLELLGRSGAQP
ncbi:MAG: glycerophosphodiester phosphodiesterase [Anaerolinea sp.]|nr:glycerophosphodiester phosphodiesterase [Anaerolinea sp.]